MGKEYEYPAILAFGYDGGRLWVANFVNLPGCWVEGEDKADVIRRAPEVLREYIRSCIEAECPLPDAPSAEDLRAADVGEVIIFRCNT